MYNNELNISLLCTPFNVMLLLLCFWEWERFDWGLFYFYYVYKFHFSLSLLRGAEGQIVMWYNVVSVLFSTKTI